LKLLLALTGLVCALTILGCANLADVSTGEVGCPADEINITDEQSHWSGKNWTAECRGELFYCTALAQDGGGAVVSCAKDRPESAGATSELPGCQYDTQCKGDRVCNAGRCEAP
jgi:hypothetical protein